MKGWTVKTKPTKRRSEGVADREIYLHNKNHPNHSKTEAMIQVWGNSSTMARIAHNGATAASKLQAKGKGGRPAESYSVEFTLNLPKGYRPTAEQWKEIAKKAIVDVAKRLNIEPQVLANQSYAVAHQQPQELEYDTKGRRVGTGDHLHLVVGKFTPDGMLLRDLQRKTVTHVVKDSFNESTMSMGFDWTQYRDHQLQAQEYSNSHTVPMWKIKSARAYDKIEQRVTQRVAQELEHNKDLERILDKFSNQAEKWLKAFYEEDSKQINRQLNRMTTSLEEVNSKINEAPEDVKGFSFSEKTLRAIEKVRGEINARSSNKLPEIKLPKKSEPDAIKL